MAKFVITEVWTRSRVVEAANQSDALEVGAPEHYPFKAPNTAMEEDVYVELEPKDIDLNLSNWHATEVP